MNNGFSISNNTLYKLFTELLILLLLLSVLTSCELQYTQMELQ